MKKNLGFKPWLDQEVPSALDSTILSYASIAGKRRLRHRRLRLATAAAAAVLCCTAGLSFNLFSHRTPERRVQQLELSDAELLALNDFSTLEQELYTIGSMTSAVEQPGETYI